MQLMRRVARLAREGQQDPNIPWMWWDEEETEEGVEPEGGEADMEM